MQISELEKSNQIELTNEMDLTPVAIEKLALMPANDILTKIDESYHRVPI